MQSTMQEFPLNVGMIFRHGRALHGDCEIATFDGTGCRRATFAEVATRVERLAVALRDLGIGPDDRVGTFMWNTQEHLEAYFAVPMSGSILHTINVRLFPEQLVYIVNDAADRVVLVDDDLVPVFARVAPELQTVERYVVVGDGDASPLEDAVPDGVAILRYDDLLAAADPARFDFPEVDEWAAATMCYTSGTTGHPKGVVYSHRSTFMHTMGIQTTAALPFTWDDRVLPIVPMFHANAWGVPHAAWMTGADLVMPGRHVQAEPLSRLIAAERPTATTAVPTIWADLLRFSDDHEVDISSLTRILVGGAAVPRALMEAYDERFGVRIVQLWGLTETSPIATASYPPRGVAHGSSEEMDWRAYTGRALPGVELRIVADDGTVLPWDGESVGEIEARGPWITGSYFGDPAPEKFDDGWLRTGDIGSMTANGYLKISDRSKDVIKSGGEWISSLELEDELLKHPDVAEVAVIGIPDPRWDERPLPCVVRRTGSSVTASELRAHLADRLARWQLPERWTFVDEIPKTGTGKLDKKRLRVHYADGELTVEQP